MIKAEHPSLSLLPFCVGFLLFAQPTEKPVTVYLIPNSPGNGKMFGQGQDFFNVGSDFFNVGYDFFSHFVHLET